MALPDSLADLLYPDAYPHPCRRIELVETHISWVLLTGDFAYKLKRPVQFSFADFSSLRLRRHFCEEELRCNRAFAPELYLGLAAVCRDAGGVRVQPGAANDTASVVEWAVRMRQFPADCQADRLLERGKLTADMLIQFGRALARKHRELPTSRFESGDLGPRVLDPVRQNFADIRQFAWAEQYAGLLSEGAALTDALIARQHALLMHRLQNGWTRECHGDLHLSNLVLLENHITAFDCIEFSPMLRWIDPLSDVAFLFMDCLFRDRADLAYAFVDGYLDASGDYEGARLLNFYAVYRSMVRAKIAALRRDQLAGQARQQAEDRCVQHMQWARSWLRRPPGILVLMCGLSGSGKSYLAGPLAVCLPALRLRSDVARKSLAGLAPECSAASPVGEGIYAVSHNDEVYGYLAQLTAELIAAGENVIIDATFLASREREVFLALASAQGSHGVIVHCDAPPSVLRQRIIARAAQGKDPSDANLAVLEDQLRRFQSPTQNVLRVDTRTSPDIFGLVQQIVQAQ